MQKKTENTSAINMDVGRHHLTHLHIGKQNDMFSFRAMAAKVGGGFSPSIIFQRWMKRCSQFWNLAFGLFQIHLLLGT